MGLEHGHLDRRHQHRSRVRFHTGRRRGPAPTRPILPVVLVVVGGLSVFAQFVGALEVIWATPPRRTPIRGFLRYNAVALALLLVATFALLATLILSALASAFAGIALQLRGTPGCNCPGMWVMLALRYAPVLIACGGALLGRLHRRP